MRSKCLTFDENIMYMNGQLGKDKQLAFESHLSNCDHCLKKIIESYELIQNPTLDKQTEAQSLIDVSNFTRWIGEQISGIYSWRPKTDFLGLGVPALQTVRVRQNTQSHLENDCSLIKVDHDRYPARLWFKKQKNSIQLIFKLQTLKSAQNPIFITLTDQDQYENTKDVSQDTIVFEHVPFGQYAINVENMDCEESIAEILIDPQQIRRIDT